MVMSTLAELVSFGRSLLNSANSLSPDEMLAAADRLERAASIQELQSTPSTLTPEQAEQWNRWRSDPAAFIADCVQIYDKTTARWIPFAPWDCQQESIREFAAGGWFIVLKRRQIGETWIVLALILWLCLVRPVQQAYLFSIGLTEAKDLTDFRLRGMVERLPAWVREAAGGAETLTQSVTFGNGSRIISLPGGSGRSYAATIVFIDEGDYNPNLPDLLAAAEPAVEGGGWMILLSTSDKTKPTSRFKLVYRAAQAGQSRYKPLFYGYGVHPLDTPERYATKAAAVLAETGALDLMHGEYPRTPDEAMAPNQLSARLPTAWLDQCFQPASPLNFADPSLCLHGLESEAPYIPGLSVWRLPQVGRRYVLGVDPSEGQPGSHESPIHVLDVDTCEEMAVFPGPTPMHILVGYVVKLAAWYNAAGVLVERNNHGHAVLLWLDSHGQGTFVMNGPDGRPGWLEGNAQKMLLYDLAAKKLRENECIIHDQQTKSQLASIEANTLKAPEGLPDDRAMSFVIGLAAADCLPRGRLDVWT
jgi:hypothetical protein